MNRTLLISLVFTVLLLPLRIGAADDSPFVRFPALNPDGTRIAFCYQGDIWTVPLSGGEARRLTIHQAYDALPKWNSDGSKIAFVSNRFEDNDIFVMPSKGGVPKRITAHSTRDTLNQWTSDDQLLFTTNRVFSQVEWFPEIQSVSAEGGTPSRIMDALGDMPSMSPDKRFIAFVKGACRLQREAYRGSANLDIWLYDTETKEYIRLTDFKGNDAYPRWADSRSIYYISAQSGKYNVHLMTLTKEGKVSERRQVTDFKDDGVRYLEVSADGKHIVMERGTAIYAMKTDGEKPVQVPIEIGSDYRFDPMEYKTYSDHAEEIAVSPDGKYTAFVVRGDVFVTENHKEKSRSVNLTSHPYRDMEVAWLSDTAVIFTSDREEQRDLYMVKSDDPNESNLFKTLKHKTVRLTQTEKSEYNPVMSPDGKKIAYVRDRGELVVADISAEGKLSNEKELLDGWATPSSVCWSPDSRWLAYSKNDLNFNEEIYIHTADNSNKPVCVSMHPRSDSRPVWSPDGSKLGFISNRNNGDNDVWFVWLRKKDWEKTKQDWKETEDEPKKENAKKDDKKKDEKDKDKVKPVIIDFEDIHERLVQVTSLPGDEWHLVISKDGKTFYYSSVAPTAKKRDLYSVKWDGTDAKAVTSGGVDPRFVKLDKTGKYLYLLKAGGRLARIDTKSSKSESLPFVAKMTVNHPQERLQIFTEACKILETGFYDPNFHGRDWGKLTAKYKKMVLKASTKRDFRDMFNLMLGQLNASHMGLYGRDPGNMQKLKTGLLGIGIVPLEKGVRVTHVVPGSPADRLDSKLNTDDVILSVDRQTIEKNNNFYVLLTNTTSEKVLLQVKDKAGNIREVVIRPTDSLRDHLYDEWVKERRRLTEKYSNGRLGYLHIRAMGWSSFERFEREITACGYGKEGIVIDVRYNGGGWTTDYLMAVLNVKQHAYTVPRGAAKDLEKEHKKFRDYYAFGERLPFAAWTKPSIALCNECSYSNAEIFSHAYKTLGLGTLVGKPTFGAVISTDGVTLIDGSFVRLPFRAWYVKATDQNMEHEPAVPDIIVEDPPGDKAKGIDRQLKRAVEELLEQIDK